MNETEALIALNMLPKIGPVRRDRSAIGVVESRKATACGLICARRFALQPAQGWIAPPAEAEMKVPEEA